MKGPIVTQAFPDGKVLIAKPTAGSWEFKWKNLAELCRTYPRADLGIGKNGRTVIMPALWRALRPACRDFY